MWISLPQNIGFSIKWFDKDNNIMSHKIHVSKLIHRGHNLAKTHSYQNSGNCYYKNFGSNYATRILKNTTLKIHAYLFDRASFEKTTHISTKWHPSLQNPYRHFSILFLIDKKSHYKSCYHNASILVEIVFIPIASSLCNIVAFELHK